MFTAFTTICKHNNRFRVSRRKGGLVGRMMFVAAMATLSANCAITVLSTWASMANYPGGSTLAKFNDQYTGRHAGMKHTG